MHIALLAALATAGPGTLNPLFAHAGADHRAQAALFEPLHRLVAGAVPSEDRHEVRLTLEPGLAWADGEPLSARDVCFTVAALTHPHTPTTWPHAAVLEGCRVDGEEAVIRFSRPVHRDPREWLGFAVLPAHAFDSPAVSPGHPFGRDPVTLPPPDPPRPPPPAVAYVALSLDDDLDDPQVRRALVRAVEGVELAGAEPATGPWRQAADRTGGEAPPDDAALLAGVPLRVGVSAGLLDLDPGAGAALCDRWVAAGAASCEVARLYGSSWSAASDRVDALVGLWTLLPPDDPAPFLRRGNPYRWDHGDVESLLRAWRTGEDAEAEVRRRLEALWTEDGAFTFLGVLPG